MGDIEAVFLDYDNVYVCGKTVWSWINSQLLIFTPEHIKMPSLGLGYFSFAICRKSQWLTAIIHIEQMWIIVRRILYFFFWGMGRIHEDIYMIMLLFKGRTTDTQIGFLNWNVTSICRFSSCYLDPPLRCHGGWRLDAMALVEDKRRPCMLWLVCDVLKQTHALCWAPCPWWCPPRLSPDAPLSPDAQALCLLQLSCPVQYWRRCRWGASTVLCL